MKKMFVLIALCAMASSLMAVEFSDENYKNGALTIPIVYTGMLKINGWGDDGLCYNWQQTRNSYPLFLGLCQPCLDCVPCDIDMRHLDPVVQYGDNEGPIDATTGNPSFLANASPTARGFGVDETEAFFNRARLYIVNSIDAANRKATVKVVDLIDAYWGKDKKSEIPVMFQFFNTVDSVGRTNANPAYGRIGAFYQFPIYSRDYYDGIYLHYNQVPQAGMADVRLNEFNRGAADDVAGHTNTKPAHLQNNATSPDCILDRTEDGIGLAALIGVKDYKAFFKVNNRAYPLVSIKAFTGDFFAWQYNYTDNDFPVWEGQGKPEDDVRYQPQYVCRKGEEFVVYKHTNKVPGTDDTEFDGKGTWYATGTITLRRNDAVTKYMMNRINTQDTQVTCIPCNKGTKAPVCRTFLDEGVVDYLIGRQFNRWSLTYIVDLDNDGIYGETTNCGGRNEVFLNAEDYLYSLVNIWPTDEAQESNAYYNLGAGAAVRDLVNSPAASAGRDLENNYYHYDENNVPKQVNAPDKP